MSASPLRRGLLAVAASAALLAMVPMAAPAAVFYLSKATARAIVVRRVSKGPPSSPTVRWWVEAAPLCARYSNIRVSCRFWAEYREPDGSIGRCYGDMIAFLTSRAQPRAYATRAVDVDCAPVAA